MAAAFVRTHNLISLVEHQCAGVFDFGILGHETAVDFIFGDRSQCHAWKCSHAVQAYILFAIGKIPATHHTLCRQDYIEQYFATYPGVKNFLDNTVADAKKQGFVTTMFGRRRPVPELTSSNFMQRSFGERVAMNSPIQGTAADIIKIAMIRVSRRLKRDGLKSKLILQVHDELLIETVKEEAEKVRKILEEEMNSAADLLVNLEVDLHEGNDWYEAK